MYQDTDTAADTKFDQKFPKILPAIKSGVGKSGNDISSLGGEYFGKQGGEGGLREKDHYNNTMVEFGSIRQS